MQRAQLTLQVIFEEPFWIGVFERWEDGQLSVCKVTFGKEPRDFEVYELICSGFYRLKFSPPVRAELRPAPKNPKRVQREARRQTEPAGLGTKSQQALQLQREAQKTMRQERTRDQKEQEARRRFALRQEKRREKHRGH
ncbi:MAG: YjdF family protein [Candidatus Onthomonas sp.]